MLLHPCPRWSHIPCRAPRALVLPKNNRESFAHGQPVSMIDHARNPTGVNPAKALFHDCGTTSTADSPMHVYRYRLASLVMYLVACGCADQSASDSLTPATAPAVFESSTTGEADTLS